MEKDGGERRRKAKREGGQDTRGMCEGVRDSVILNTLVHMFEYACFCVCLCVCMAYTICVSIQEQMELRRSA